MIGVTLKKNFERRRERCDTSTLDLSQQVCHDNVMCSSIPFVHNVPALCRTAFKGNRPFYLMSF